MVSTDPVDFVIELLSTQISVKAAEDFTHEFNSERREWSDITKTRVQQLNLFWRSKLAEWVVRTGNITNDVTAMARQHLCDCNNPIYWCRHFETNVFPTIVESIYEDV